MRLGVKIMAMPVLELASLIEDKTMENPFLLIDEEAPESAQKTPSERRAESSSAMSRTEALDEDAWEHGVEPGVWDASWEDGRATGALASASPAPDDLLMGAADERKSPEEALLSQLSCDLRDEMDIQIARRLLDGIDERGYLHMDTDFVADEMGVEPNRVERVLWQMQRGCTPAGIGARSLAERLVAQLESAKLADAITRRVIENHLSDLAEGRLAQIADALKVAPSDIKRSFDKIRMLDPDPMSAFESASPLMVPEVSVVRGDGGWTVKLRRGLLPSVAFNESYADLLETCTMEARTAKQLQALIREAKGFLRAVDLRSAAIAAIARVVVERQSAFFDEGQTGLRALTMAEVAEATELSEATVSRVANSIAMDSPQGVRSLRFFFTSGVRSTESGDDVSSLAVKQAIRELVNGEDPRSPLSDGKLVALLEERGLSVSRRTVNKYRTALGILSKSKRKIYE